MHGVGPEVESAPRFFEGIFKNEDGEDRLDLKWTEEATGGEGKVLHLHKKTEYNQSTPKFQTRKSKFSEGVSIGWVLLLSWLLGSVLDPEPKPSAGLLFDLGIGWTIVAYEYWNWWKRGQGGSAPPLDTNHVGTIACGLIGSSCFQPCAILWIITSLIRLGRGRRGRV